MVVLRIQRIDGSTIEEHRPEEFLRIIDAVRGMTNEPFQLDKERPKVEVVSIEPRTFLDAQITTVTVKEMRSVN